MTYIRLKSIAKAIACKTAANFQYERLSVTRHPIIVYIICYNYVNMKRVQKFSLSVGHATISTAP